MVLILFQSFILMEEPVERNEGCQKQKSVLKTLNSPLKTEVIFIPQTQKIKSNNIIIKKNPNVRNKVMLATSRCRGFEITFRIHLDLSSL